MHNNLTNYQLLKFLALLLHTTLISLVNSPALTLVYLPFPIHLQLGTVQDLTKSPTSFRLFQDLNQDSLFSILDIPGLIQLAPRADPGPDLT